MSPTDELTAFPSLRGECLFAMGKPKEGLEAHEAALSISPHSRLQQIVVQKAKERVAAQAAVAWLPPEVRDNYWNQSPAAPNPQVQIRR
jgi:hypothetical protein